VNKSVIEIAKTVIKTEAEAILELQNRINENFDEVCHLLANCKGKVILTGMGKSGHIAKKIASTLSSTGTACNNKIIIIKITFVNLPSSLH